jgi:anthranilate phosphoribosyltransferase
MHLYSIRLKGRADKEEPGDATFNMLGPMANPANPAYQLVECIIWKWRGFIIFIAVMEIVHYHSRPDGYDEISLTNDTKVITNEGERIMTPEQLGKRMVVAADISGGNTVEEAAKIFATILRGEGTWAQNAVVLANAAMALHCTGKYKKYDEAYSAAVESLESGRANECLSKLMTLQ